MSSDIDEDCDSIYSSPRGGASAVRSKDWTNSPLNMIHSYVNIVDRSDSEEPRPALPARKEKQKAKSSQRTSRSKDREKGKEREPISDYEKIKERERELERIHRRSRELMCSPRSRESSSERGKNRVLDHHYRMSAQPPHFPPPPCHPPPPLSAAPNSHSRYKSSSPACQDVSNVSSSKQYSNSMRRRVISPSRKDYRNVSQAHEFRSPNRGARSTDDEDSGADSMNEIRSNNSNHSCHSWNVPHQHQSPHQMALVPYDSHGSCRSCCPSYNHPHNMQVALPSSIEDRLLALEDDKDKLHVQVAVLSDQIENQTDKITDLEKILDDKKEVLKKTEDVLQREILNKSSLETQKLELLSEITDIKIRQSATDRENLELRRRLQKTLHLSDSSLDSSRSLPRRPSYHREGSQPPTGGFRPFKFPIRALEKEATPPAEPKHFFFRRSGSVRESRSKNSSKSRERDKSRDSSSNHTNDNSHSQQNPIATKPKGFKKILSKMRRANSGPIPQDLKKEFETDKEQCRASAGSQLALGWELQKGLAPFESDVPFKDWDSDIICSWFDSMGLYMYSNEVKKCIKTGEQLATFSNTDLEVKLGILNTLHRKKVLLALMTRTQKCEDPAGNLDHQWVTRWLDDVGLPQYKDAFLEARVDGRVLNFLTIDDLFQLKVTNQLHHLSLRRGIQVLRENNFEPSCLKRRGNPGERDSQIVHSDVVFWTNHRVMEWLRHVDLSEYAPNLRGSGVHGALLVLEKRFTAELLAGVLSIPSSKTLLRRHLSLHIKDLLGPDVIQEKREAENQPNFQPLSPTSKAKQPKKGQFTLKRKKSKSEMDFEDMVCPLSSK
eukprot:GFUD01003158.1.p1 GENE.GFUD01003158.1~~GFUD01003158.1.p1  ORF type:complete len:836 (+),score=169.21 GFUD01003158.1:155-2662(+)